VGCVEAIVQTHDRDLVAWRACGLRISTLGQHQKHRDANLEAAPKPLA